MRNWTCNLQRFNAPGCFSRHEQPGAHSSEHGEDQPLRHAPRAGWRVSKCGHDDQPARSLLGMANMALIDRFLLVTAAVAFAALALAVAHVMGAV